jgi:hypothetical protein
VLLYACRVVCFLRCCNACILRQVPCSAARLLGRRCGYAFLRMYSGILLGGDRAMQAMTVPLRLHVQGVCLPLLGCISCCVCGTGCCANVTLVSVPYGTVSLSFVSATLLSSCCLLHVGTCSGVVSMADMPVPVSCAEYQCCASHADLQAEVAATASLGSSCSGCFPC